MKRSLLFLLLITVLISCKDKNEPITANVVTYPMTDGTQWTYDHEVINKHFELEKSTNPVLVDTSNYVAKVWIEKDTVLMDKTVKMFKSQEVGYNLTSVEFNYIDNEGLKTFAHIRSGYYMFASEPVHLKSAAGIGPNTGDVIRYEVTPTLNIPLPLKSDSKWTYRLPDDYYPFQIDKEVTGQETLKLAGQEFNCFKLNWIYVNEPAYDSVHMTDWISAKGLIKRSSSYNRIWMQDENGETIWYSEITHTMTLKALVIK